LYLSAMERLVSKHLEEKAKRAGFKTK